MRYWHPLSDETARAVRDWQPDEVVLLPLYPQYSTTTTGSSLTAWREAAARVGLVADTTVCAATRPTRASSPPRLRCCARRVHAAREQLDPTTRLRVLFSAHGLPERSCGAAIRTSGRSSRPSRTCWRTGARRLDWVICYQSRATPQHWIGPSTEAEIERAAHDGVAVLVVPIAFVSEHSETLVELDIDYRALAERLGVPGYFRVPTQNADPAFIAAWRIWSGARARTVQACAAMPADGSARADRSLCPLAMTIGFLAVLYPWTKAFHVIAMIAWMAGMFYLPRLFVYHCELRPGSAESERFKVMERRLLKQIINPAMIATWTFGILLVLTPGIIDWSAGWWHVKLAMVLLMSGFHGAMSRWRRDFLEDRNTRPQRSTASPTRCRRC